MNDRRVDRYLVSNMLQLNDDNNEAAVIETGDDDSFIRIEKIYTLYQCFDLLIYGCQQRRQ
jgi:hypothetical protein